MDSDRDAATAIEDALLVENGLAPDEARDAAFHMTDWLDDLRAYSAFVASPQDYSPQQVSSLVGQFLVHAPNHLAAAAKLWGQPVEDMFGTGALDGDAHS